MLFFPPDLSKSNSLQQPENVVGRDRGTVIIKTLVLKYKKGLILGVLEVCS